jgi:hypothetical protein
MSKKITQCDIRAVNWDCLDHGQIGVQFGANLASAVRRPG